MVSAGCCYCCRAIFGQTTICRRHLRHADHCATAKVLTASPASQAEEEGTALQDLVEWLALGHVDRVAIWMLFLAWAASVVQVHWAAWQARSSGVQPVSGETGTGAVGTMHAEFSAASHTETC